MSVNMMDSFDPLTFALPKKGDLVRITDHGETIHAIISDIEVDPECPWRYNIFFIVDPES